MTDPLLKGRFAMYETPEGGYHIAYINDGQDDTRHIEIPAFIVRLGQQMSEGKASPVDMVKVLMTRGK